MLKIDSKFRARPSVPYLFTYLSQSLASKSSMQIQLQFNQLFTNFIAKPWNTGSEILFGLY